MGNSLKFPILLFGRNEGIEFLKKSDQLFVTNRLGLKCGLLLGCKIIDSAGNEFEILAVNKLRNKNPVWKFEFFNPMIEIDLLFKPLETSTVEDLKRRVQRRVSNDLQFWKFTNKKELQREFNKVQSFEELFKLLTEHTT